jgi:hypothetical protein
MEGPITATVTTRINPEAVKESDHIGDFPRRGNKAQERGRCSPRDDWRVYPRLRRTMRASTAARKRPARYFRSDLGRKSVGGSGRLGHLKAPRPPA